MGVLFDPHRPYQISRYSKSHTDSFACHSSEWETPRLSPIFLFCYYLRTSRSLEMTSTVDAKGREVFWLCASPPGRSAHVRPCALYHGHHLNAGAGGGNVIGGFLELVAIALNVLEVVAQDASNRLFNQNGFRRHAGFRRNFAGNSPALSFWGVRRGRQRSKGAVYPIGK